MSWNEKDKIGHAKAVVYSLKAVKPSNTYKIMSEKQCRIQEAKNILDKQRSADND